MKLLTPENYSPKLAKTEGSKYLTAILYLAGAADKRLCPAATAGCRAACLVPNSGRGIMKKTRDARQAKSDFLFNNPIAFKYILSKDIESLERKAKKLGKIPAVRLNGGSDLNWSDIYKEFPNVQFWEYVANPALAVQLSRLDNVHVTFSNKETTSDRTIGTMLKHDINVAIVFNTWSKKKDKLPDYVGSLPVIDGDEHDLRFLDPKGVIVGLRFKSAKRPEENNNNKFLKAVGE